MDDKELCKTCFFAGFCAGLKLDHCNGRDYYESDEYLNAGKKAGEQYERQ